ncbi:MAG: hypothetical protein IKU61_05060 [Clostridia bacterium]|nr:hypothetical protein [Clostridia bacterium]
MFFRAICLASLRRYAELILTATFLSSLVTFINISEFVTLRPYVMIMLIVATLIFLAINVVFMRDSYFELGDCLMYYIANLIAYGAFSVTACIIYKVSNVAFTWMFGISKTLLFAPIDIMAKYSLLLFLALGGIATMLAPIGMQKYVDDAEQMITEKIESIELFEEQMKQANLKNEE